MTLNNQTSHPLINTFAEEWDAAAMGGEDFWLRADTFVEQKRKKEINASTSTNPPASFHVCLSRSKSATS
ncbi:hypothetical protein B0H11DRAFT_2259425 [Mycena galericulata]|nr:hypothetical protein B0H11DRAFT_2259425 [Mycena galericulata]